MGWGSLHTWPGCPPLSWDSFMFQCVCDRVTSCCTRMLSHMQWCDKSIRIEPWSVFSPGAGCLGLLLGIRPKQPFQWLSRLGSSQTRTWFYCRKKVIQPWMGWTVGSKPNMPCILGCGRHFLSMNWATSSKLSQRTELSCYRNVMFFRLRNKKRKSSLDVIHKTV